MSLVPAYLINNIFSRYVKWDDIIADVAGQMGLDVGAESAKLFAEAVARAKTIVWNGEWRRKGGGVEGRYIVDGWIYPIRDWNESVKTM